MLPAAHALPTITYQRRRYGLWALNISGVLHCGCHEKAVIDMTAVGSDPGFVFSCPCGMDYKCGSACAQPDDEEVS